MLKGKLGVELIKQALISISIAFFSGEFQV